MSPGIILGLAVAAGLACPAHMWWSHRRGRQGACGLPSPNTEAGDEIEALRARQELLRALIAENGVTALGAASQHETARK